MTTTEFKVSDSSDFDNDVRLISHGVEAISQGIHAIGVMYDEHSLDPKSQENIRGYGESLDYRVNALSHIVAAFRDEFNRTQQWVLSAHEQDLKEKRSYYPRMPHLKRAEEQLTVHLDSLIFHTISAFDYAGHMLLYMAKTAEKHKTNDWDALHRICNNKDSWLHGSHLAIAVRRVGDNYVQRLQHYRGRLIHKEKDHHSVHIVYNAESSARIIMKSSEKLKRTFQKIFAHEGDYSTKVFITWFVSKSLIELANVLFAISKDILSDSHFAKNIQEPKGNKGFSIVIAGPGGRALPVSDSQWRGHRAKIVEFAALAGLANELDISS